MANESFLFSSRTTRQTSMRYLTAAKEKTGSERENRKLEHREYVCGLQITTFFAFVERVVFLSFSNLDTFVT